MNKTQKEKDETRHFEQNENNVIQIEKFTHVK